ncbi:PhnE/PtxC family ABC transporter permease [Enterococcus sp. LJL90]
MDFRQNEPEALLPQGELALGELMRHTRKQKIRIRIWSINRLVPWLLFLFLAVVSGYTFLTMDYGDANLATALGQFFTDLRRMFFQPQLSGRFTFMSLVQALGITVGLSILTTLIGSITAFFFSLMTARNIANPTVSTIIRMFMSFVRAVPTILWVLIFSILIGLGANAAIIGMAFHSVAYLTKVYSESIEEIDSGTIEALKACGANFWQIVFQGILPVCLTSLLSWTFIRFEINFTNAIAVGAAAGAGGLGFQLAMLTGFYFDLNEIGMVVYMILAVVAVLEIISLQLRKKFIVKG